MNIFSTRESRTFDAASSRIYLHSPAMGRLVNVDGELLAPEKAFISVFDRGFLYGDSVYEVVRTYGGVPFELEAHLRRLRHSAELIGLTLPRSEAQLDREVRRTLVAAQNPESYARIIITRGSGELGLDPALARDPRAVIIVRELVTPPPEAYEQGVKVALVSVRRNLREALDPAAKTGNYLNSVLAMGEARQRSAYEALMLDHQDRVTEGASSNVFVARKGALLTPPLDGILEGVTRRIVLDLARQLGIPAGEQPLTPEDLYGADELFITSTTRELVPVCWVDEHRVGNGKVGPLARKLLAAYRERALRAVGGAR